MLLAALAKQACDAPIKLDLEDPRGQAQTTARAVEALTSEVQEAMTRCIQEAQAQDRSDAFFGDNSSLKTCELRKSTDVLDLTATYVHTVTEESNVWFNVRAKTPYGTFLMDSNLISGQVACSFEPVPPPGYNVTVIRSVECPLPMQELAQGNAAIARENGDPEDAKNQEQMHQDLLEVLSKKREKISPADRKKFQNGQAVEIAQLHQTAPDRNGVRDLIAYTWKVSPGEADTANHVSCQGTVQAPNQAYGDQAIQFSTTGKMTPDLDEECTRWIESLEGGN